jgi:hypothetical protein
MFNSFTNGCFCIESLFHWQKSNRSAVIHLLECILMSHQIVLPDIMDIKPCLISIDADK